MLDDEVIAPDVVDADPAPAPSPPVRRRSRRRLLVEYLPIVALLLVVAWFCKVFYQPGHDWGDDFALYIHQAKGLVNGNVGEVIAQNRYAVDNSGWSSFSPVVYPWGFPLLIAPIVALWGVNYAKLKVFVIATFLGYLFCLYRLVLRRAGVVPAALIVALVGASVTYVGWTASVLSDYPFLFFATLTLLWFDRCRLRNLFEADGLRDLIILGGLIGFSFSIRREGLALLAALFAIQVVMVGPRLFERVRVRLENGQARAPRGPSIPIRWSRIAVPWVSFALMVGALQLALPSVLLPRYAGTGTQQIKPNIIWFRDILAELLGLKDVGVNKLELLGSWRLAAAALTVFLALAVIGFLVRLATAIFEDVTIAAYLLAICYIVGTAPFHEGRYLYGIMPLLAYFAVQALPALAKSVRQWVRPATVVSCVLVAGLVFANLTDMRHAIDYHRAYPGTIDGPTAPAALEMEQKVRDCTRGDDVVTFFRARAMSMLTDRRSIQTGNLDQVLQRSDWFVMEKDSTYSQPLVSDKEAARVGLRKIWENSDWVLWLVPGGAADGRHLPC